jgi:hypothetical protein
MYNKTVKVDSGKLIIGSVCHNRHLAQSNTLLGQRWLSDRLLPLKVFVMATGLSSRSFGLSFNDALVLGLAIRNYLKYLRDSFYLCIRHWLKCPGHLHVHLTVHLT